MTDLPASAPAARLVAEPGRFSFDAAMRIVASLRRRPGTEAARFSSASGMAFPAAEVTAVETTKVPAVTVALFGLTGPAGVLPRHYSEAVIATLRNRSRGLHDFLDVLSQAMTAFFAAAGVKYRPHRAADASAVEDQAGQAGRTGSNGGPVADALLALTGYATPHLSERLPAGASPLQHYAGLFSARPRSADRLAALASDWLARPVEVVQFAGAWLSLPPDQRTRLAQGMRLGSFSQLGEDAAVGVRAWDPQARIVLRVGPLAAGSFHAMLPDRSALRELVGLVRAFVGFEVGFAINPILARDAVPAMQLGAATDGPRLGWNTWMPQSGARPHHADEAVFEAELVEGLVAQGGAR